MTLATAALLTTSLGAHHSYPAYDRETPVRLEGTLRTVGFRNPHVILDLDTTSGERYHIEWASTFQLVQQGVERDRLKPGDRIVIVGHVKRDRSKKEMSLVRMIRRPDDGWQWGEAPVTAESSS
jgi:hypothetical protein